MEINANANRRRLIMGVPKIISKNNHEYIFVKQVNKNMFLYKDMLYGYNECFTKFDLGMVKEIVEPPKTEVKPERVKFL
jgi:hypothetical protein